MFEIIIPETGHSIQVAKKDLAKSMDWYKAKRQSEKKGDGWRLPTRDELKIIYSELHEKALGDFGNVNYWSGIEDEEDSDYAYGLCFEDGYTYWNSKFANEYVRLVRDL